MGGRLEPETVTTPARDRSWYSITNLSASEAEILLYDEIGMFGITAADFISDLRAIKAKSITLRINSPGGEVFDSLAIYNALVRHPASITAYVDGAAASAASFIFMAGDKRVMSPHSQLFIHDAHGLTLGSAADMIAMAEFLNKASDNIAAIYAEKANGTVEEWREKMRAETWFSDREAVEAGLADEIDGVVIEDRAPARIKNEQPIEPTPDPEPEPAPVSVDFHQVFEEIEEEALESLFAVA